ncbi:MAG: hypothetical protein V4694_02285 [Pseudomonadota bacterium]
MKIFNPIPEIFLTGNPDEVKKFNEALSQVIIGKMDAAYEILASGQVEDYVEKVDQIIAESFPTEAKFTLNDLRPEASGNIVGFLKDISACEFEKYSLNKKALTDRNGIPVFKVDFPRVRTNLDDYISQCQDPAIPTDTPLTPLAQTSYINHFNQFIAGIVTKSNPHAALVKVLENPPHVSPNEIPISTQNYCTIPPFFQNLVLASDELSKAGGRKYFKYVESDSRQEDVSFMHNVYSQPAGLSSARAWVGGVDNLYFNNDYGSTPYSNWYLLHETLHSMGMGHVQDDEKVRVALKEWAIKTGDPFPSISGYSDQVITNDGPVKNFFSIEDMMRGDSRYAYYRPYDVLYLETKRHEKMICLPQREQLGMVIDSANITRTSGQESMSQYLKELQDSSFETLSTSSQRIIAHSLKRLVGVEMPIAVAGIAVEEILQYYKTDDPEQYRLRKFITSENGINAVKSLVRAGANLATMGVNPTIASFMLQGAIGVGSEIGKNVCGVVSKQTGFGESEIAKRFTEASEYISSYVPPEVTKALFGMAMIMAVNAVQYSDYVEGYKSNFDLNYNPIPRASISPFEIAITSCVVGVLATAFSAVLKEGVKRFKGRGRDTDSVAETASLSVGEIDIEMGGIGSVLSEVGELPMVRSGDYEKVDTTSDDSKSDESEEPNPDVADATISKVVNKSQQEK